MAETFASKLFPRTPKLLRSEPLKALVIGAFVRGLSMGEVESLCEQAGLGKLSKSSASRICEELKERFERLRRRDLYDNRSGGVVPRRDLHLGSPPAARRRACWSRGVQRGRRARAAVGELGDA